MRCVVCGRPGQQSACCRYPTSEHPASPPAIPRPPHFCRPAALLVCKRWQAVLYGTPALWRQLEVDAPDLPAEAEEAWAAWEASLPVLLSRVANYAAAARLASRSRRGAHWVCSTLRQLHPATITAVSILACQLPPDLLALEPLCRLTRLTSLQLTSDGAQLPEPIDPLLGLACLLPKLPLHSVRLDARGLHHGILTPLAKLPGLTDLRLVSRAGPLPALQLLTQLAQLRQLWVEDRSSRLAQLQAPLPYPADFQQLERYTFRSLFKNNLRVRLGGRLVHAISAARRLCTRLHQLAAVRQQA